MIDDLDDPLDVELWTCEGWEHGVQPDGKPETQEHKREWPFWIALRLAPLRGLGPLIPC